MLPSPNALPPTGEGWVHEAKIDGYRCMAQVHRSRVRLWSRGAGEWTGRLPELEGLASLGDVVLDGEVAVVTSSGQADFELLGSRIRGRRQGPDAHPVTLFVFDVLEADGVDLRERPWTSRREILDDLDVVGYRAGAARATVWTEDGAAMHEATRSLQAERTVSKRSGSPYQAGRSRRWTKAKHKTVQALQVAGWRPSRPGRPGGLIVAEEGQPIGVATLALPDSQRAALVDLLRRYGRLHPTGAVTIPDGCLEAEVRYTSRTPTHGHLREAFVDAVTPAGALGGVPLP
jgi:bifunctional non-homologous end joining protein LigD